MEGCEPAMSTAQRQASNAGVVDDASHGRKSETLQGRIDVFPEAAPLE